MKIKEIIRKRIKGMFTVREIISMTYEKIKERHAYQEIFFSDPVLSLIADDSDYHRTRRGFMKYDSMILVRLGRKIWALGKGKAWGDYPAEPYDSDILVLEMQNNLSKSPDEINAKIRSLIKWHSMFSDSIIAGRKSGHLFPGSKWEKKVTELVKPKLSAFIQKKLETHEGYITVETGGTFPAIKSPIMYKKELADFLVKTIIEILNDFNSE